MSERERPRQRGSGREAAARKGFKGSAQQRTLVGIEERLDLGLVDGRARAAAAAHKEAVRRRVELPAAFSQQLDRLLLAVPSRIRSGERKCEPELQKKAAVFTRT